jgi:Dienelactone hydrolase and related enzymes
MATVVLFHHALGLTDGVVRLAEEIRSGGHTVHTPDLYDGRTFGDLAEGVEFAKSLGFGTVADRGAHAVESLPMDLFYVGISLGVLPAQRLAQTRRGARGAVLISACFHSSEFGPSWPEGVRLQVHGMEADPEFANEWDLPAARALVEEASEGELFLYRGDQHLFVDRSLPSFDENAAALLVRRLLTFLEGGTKRGP